MKLMSQKAPTTSYLGMKNKIDWKKYDRILFSDKTTNRTTLRDGYRVGEFLAVSFSDNRMGEDTRYRIYRYRDGHTCLKTTFLTAGDAILVAEWLDKTYRDEFEDSFFFIWNEYPNIDLWRLTHLTIENGEKYLKFLERLDKQKNVRWEDVCQYLS